MEVGINMKPSSEVRTDNRIAISVASVVVTQAQLLVGWAEARHSWGSPLVRRLTEFAVRDNRRNKVLRFFADRAAKKWPFRGSFKYAGVLLAYPP